MRVLVMGANGQVGRATLERLGPEAQVLAASRTGRLADGSEGIALDAADPAAVREAITTHRPDLVINAAAYTAVDRAEDEPEAAERVNAIAPAVMAEACSAIGARLVHYSTDYVFDGSGTQPYRETDRTAPLGAYGRSKEAGERAVLAHEGHLVLRTAWVYDLEGQNFLNTMRRLGAERDVLRVVDDQYGSPTPAWLIADVTARLLAAGVPGGLRHVTSSGHTSWCGFAQTIFDELHERGLLARRPRVDPIATADYPTRARRPAWSVLDNSRVRAELGTPLPAWRDALRETFERERGL